MMKFSFFSPYLLVWILFGIYPKTTSNPDSVSRTLTTQQLEIPFERLRVFPDFLPVFIREAHNRTIRFIFKKKNVDYNVPVYYPRINKDGKEFVILETPPIKNAAFYEDEKYHASVTLYCKKNDPLSSVQHACNEHLMSGFFYFNGSKYVIEPKKVVSKRFTLNYSRNPRIQFKKRHQVFKLHGNRSFCDISDNENIDKKYSNRLQSTKINSNENGKSKRSKVKYTIELMALFTYKLPINETYIKEMKLYYTHVVWGANTILQNIKRSDMSFSVDLVGFIVQPSDASIYKFPNGDKNAKYILHEETLNAIGALRMKTPCDYIAMFTDYAISPKRWIGYTKTGTMCSNISAAIIKNQGNFREVFTLSHTIGHALGSIHDGVYDFVGGRCSNVDEHVMAPWFFISTNVTNLPNHFKFSDCSFKLFAQYIRDKLKTKNCMLESVKKEAITPKVPTGQLFSIQKQCRIMSNKKGLCKKRQYRKISTFCLSVWCENEVINCSASLVAYKTTCGNKKWCIYGQCVYDTKAPEADVNCLYGDDENLNYVMKLNNGKSHTVARCEEFKKLKPNFCDDKTLQRRCCDTCFKLTGKRLKTLSGSSALTPIFKTRLSILDIILFAPLILQVYNILS